MNSPDNRTDELIRMLQSVAPEELLSRTTCLYVSTLPDELRTPVYCGAILRWFDRDVLEAVLRSQELMATGVFFSDEVIASAYEQLQRMAFVEPYPGRGYTFHELTRKSLLDSLWAERRIFYLAVSSAAFRYFAEKVALQNKEYEAGDISEDQIDAGLLIEMHYHKALLLNSEALKDLQKVIDFLYESMSLGLHHDMIVALDDHIAGGRVDQRMSPFSALWKAREAFGNWESDLLEGHAQPLADSDPHDVPVEIIIGALDLLGQDSERRSRYGPAHEFFTRALTLCESNEDRHGVTQVLISLSSVALGSGDFIACQRYLEDALQSWVETNTLPNSDTGVIPAVKYDTPEFWSRQELELTWEDEDAEEIAEIGDSDDEKIEETVQRVVLYFLPLAEHSFDDADDEQLWPVQVDYNIAQIWLTSANLAEDEEDWDRAATCARLSGMIFVDIGILSGAYDAVSLLSRIGAQVLDQNLIQGAREYRTAIAETAAQTGDQLTLYRALVSDAMSLDDRLELDESRRKWNDALSIATDLRSDNGRAMCLRGLAGIEWRKGNVAEARRFLDSAIALYKELNNLEGLGYSLVTRSDFESGRREFSFAKDCAEKALAIYGDLGLVLGQFEALQRIALINEEEGRYEEAFETHRQALKIARNHKKTSLVAVVLSSMAGLQLALGRNEEAKRNYDKAVMISRKSRNSLLEQRILRGKASTLTDLAEYAESNEVLNQVLDANPEDDEAWRLKAWCLDRLGPERAHEAIEARRRAIQIAPKEIYCHRDLADALELHGNQREAERERRWIVAEFGADPNPSELSSLGWCYYKLSEFEAAAEAFHGSMSVSSDTASDRFDLALVNASMGQLGEAVRDYERALSALSERLPPRTRLGLLFVAEQDLKDLLTKVPSLNDRSEISQMGDLLSRAKAAALA